MEEGKDQQSIQSNTTPGPGKNHVHFVNIACCKSIMVTLLIMSWDASQYYFVRTVDFFVCVLNPISGVFTTQSNV